MDLFLKIRQSTFTLIVLVCSLNSINAQKLDENPLYARAGFKGGINYSTIIGDVDSPKGRIRVHLGVVLEYPISEKFYVQGELLYSAQGYSIDVDDMEQNVSLNYLTLPILTKLYLTQSISLETGPQFSLLNTVGNDDVADNDPFFNSFNDFDFSWGIGGSYRLESGLFFQLRYNLGFSNINKASINNRNSIAQLSIGYLFKTKNNRRQLYER